MAFPPQKNPPGHKSAKNEAQPHPKVMGMSRGQVSNLQGTTHPRPFGNKSKATPERSQGFRFPSSFSGAAKPGGPKKTGLAYKTQGNY